ncbi:MAG: hypothetical protein HOE86_10470 [Gemmatimonadetes bacterium]|jgi:hypothetical protein|nr:hypothetical protein [Gemmatimonadota bacterium]
MTMRNPLAVPITISVCLLITGATFAISGRNVAPDAVTRATTWNSHVGEFSTLSDGQIPSTDSAAPPFIWETKGILVFEWSEPVFLDSMRIYVGDVGNNYQVRAYLGGRLDETGTLREPEGQQTALLNIDDRVVDQWVEVSFAAGTQADNIELWSLGPTVFYEVEILAPASDETSVRPLSWSQIKWQAMPRSR